MTDPGNEGVDDGIPSDPGAATGTGLSTDPADFLVSSVGEINGA